MKTIKVYHNVNNILYVNETNESEIYINQDRINFISDVNNNRLIKSAIHIGGEVLYSSLTRAALKKKLGLK